MEKIREKKDVEILQKMDIIAMTTTGAAKYKRVLQQIKAKIMVVEFYNYLLMQKYSPD